MVCTQLLTAGDAEKAREQFTQVTVLNLLISMPFVLQGLFGTPLAVRLLGASPDQVLIYPLTYQYAQILLLSAPLFFMNMLLYSYIRVDSGEVRASVGFVAGTAVDFVLNFVFVLGFDLGVRGAILATVAGQILSILIYSGHFFGKKHILRFRFKGFRLDLREMRRCFWIGLSGSVRYALISVLLLIENHVLLRHFASRSVAVLMLLTNVNYVAFSPFEGTLSALQPLVSTFIAEHHIKESRDTLRRACIIASLLTAELLIPAFVFAPQICSLFGISDPSGIKAGTTAVRIFLVSIPIAGLNTLYAGFAQASGHEKQTVLMTALRTFIVPVPCLFLLVRLNSMSAVWWMYPVTETVSLLIFLIFIVRYNRMISEGGGEARLLRTELTAEEPDIARVLLETEAFCDRWKASVKQRYYVTLTVEEICSAIIANAFPKQNVRRNTHSIQITQFAKENGDFELRLRDSAASFNPFDMMTKMIRNAENTEGLDSIGILMVKKKAKQFLYRRYLGFNVLVITV